MTYLASPGGRMFAGTNFYCWHWNVNYSHYMVALFVVKGLYLDDNKTYTVSKVLWDQCLIPIHRTKDAYTKISP